MAMPEITSSRSVDLSGIVRAYREQKIDHILNILDTNDPARFMFAEPLSKLNTDNPRDDQNFADGIAGLSAWHILRASNTCEALGEQCDEEPMLTLDYEVLREFEQIPICLEHLGPAVERIQQDFTSRGSVLLLGVNGHGRA